MYIYERPDWPDFFADVSVTRPLEDQIAEKRGFLDGLMVSIRHESDTVMLLADSLKASWSIEGIELSDADIYSSVSRRLGIPFAVDSRKPYYEGIADVLLDAVQNHGPLTLERILSWQKRIAEINPGVKCGAFRTGPVYVISRGGKNTEIIYEAPPAAAVPAMMADFLKFVNESDYSNSVTAAIAHCYFVAIHPFEDGNGRTVRIISDYLISKDSERLPSAFVSTEIKKKQKEYYTMLDAVSKGSSMDVTAWVVWVLERMLDAYDTAIARIRKSFAVKALFERAEKKGANPRQLRFLSRVLEEGWSGPLTARKYALITSCHPDTANRDLKKLVDAGIIRKEDGGGKNTHYSVVL